MDLVILDLYGRVLMHLPDTMKESTNSYRAKGQYGTLELIGNSLLRQQGKDTLVLYLGRPEYGPRNLEPDSIVRHPHFRGGDLLYYRLGEERGLGFVRLRVRDLFLINRGGRSQAGVNRGRKGKGEGILKHYTLCL